MPVTHFPDPRLAGPEGILAVGGDLHPQTLVLAYHQGIFPWPVEDPESGEMILAWFCPARRAILDFSAIHVPRSLERARRKGAFKFTLDQAFDRVIRACASSPRPGQKGTWITPELVASYIEFHRLGYAHSIEAWDPSGRLVGGIYGVEVGGTFAGESMFHRESNASKLALLYLVEQLQSRGLDWMDVQMMTPHLKALGATELSRDAFLLKLARTHARGLRPFGTNP